MRTTDPKGKYGMTEFAEACWTMGFILFPILFCVFLAWWQTR